MKVPENWTFESDDIASGFDSHVREQLPWYDMLTVAVAHIARHYIPQGGLVYDVGASTGNIGNAISETLSERGASLIPIESAKQMAEKYRGPFPENMIISDASGVDIQPFDFAVCFLTIMFMRPSDRSEFIARLESKCRPGGAIVIVDKMSAFSGYLATVLWRLTLSCKIKAGADPADVARKELSLGGVQRPITPNELGSNARQFFQFGEFGGWIIEAGH